MLNFRVSVKGAVTGERNPPTRSGLAGTISWLLEAERCERVFRLGPVNAPTRSDACWYELTTGTLLL